MRVSSQVLYLSYGQTTYTIASSNIALLDFRANLITIWEDDVNIYIRIIWTSAGTPKLTLRGMI